MKKQILNCILSEKVYFDPNKDATVKYTAPIDVILSISEGLVGRGKKKQVDVDLFSLFAPQGGLFSNQFWDELRVYRTLNYLIIQVMNNR
jgi:hypothetical protein